METQIEIRPIQQHEVGTFLSHCRRNGLFCVHFAKILQLFRNNPEEFLFASLKGEIVGTCWNGSIGKNRLMVGGLTAKKGFPTVLREFVTFILKKYPNMIFDINIPASLRFWFHELGWTRHWDIHLYTAHISQIHTIPFRYGQEYLVETIESDNLLDLNSLEEIQMLLNISIEHQTSRREVVLKLRIPNGTSACGSLVIAEQQLCLIGPVIARDQEAAKYLLKTMFMYLKDKVVSGNVLTYILSNNIDYSNFLNASGFQKFSREWSRYSLNETDYVKDYFTYEEARSMVSSLACILFSVL